MNRLGRKRIYHITLGAVYGRHIVLSFAGRDRTDKNEVWLCRCDCGNEIKLSTSNLVNQQTMGCNKCKGKKLTCPESALKRMYRTYLRGARLRGLCFELSFHDFVSITNLRCYYCGVPPTVNSYSNGSKVSVPVNGIDRVEPSIGYTKQNTVPCCKICNNAKWDLSASDFVAWLQRIARMQRLTNG